MKTQKQHKQKETSEVAASWKHQSRDSKESNSIIESLSNQDTLIQQPNNTKQTRKCIQKYLILSR